MNIKLNARRFFERARSESGTATIEFLLFVPAMIWVLVASYVYFDLYRAEYYLNRASLTISDMLSREKSPVNPQYLDGTRNVLREMIKTDGNPDFRVTVIGYEAGGDKHSAVWSRNRGWGGNLSNADLASIKQNIPEMADGDRVILLEVRSKYAPPFKADIGLFGGSLISETEMSSHIYVSPRYAKNLCWDQNPSSATNPLNC